MVADAIAGVIHVGVVWSTSCKHALRLRIFHQQTNKEVNKNGVLNCIWGGIDNGIVRFAH
jgi:hypothetical protein